jgi:copper chaperone CopZ
MTNPINRCPDCHSRGKNVKPITLRSLLTPEAAQRICETPYRFCDSIDCDTVYFGENGDTFSKGELTVRVGVKEHDAPRQVCYCFDHTIEEINTQVQNTAKSTVLDDIKSRMKTACWCETKSPQGGCCLGTVGKYVKLAVAEHEGEVAANTDDKKQPDCCSPSSASAPANDKTQRSGVIAAMGSLASAIAASACCWLPLLLIGFGASAGGVSAWFEQYRPIFLSLAGILLALGFYLVYRPVPACGPGSACDVPRLKLRRFNQATIWFAAILVAAFALFPNYAGQLIAAVQAPAVVNGERTQGQTITLAIEGMTCEACAVGLKHQLEQTPGVAAANVNYKHATASVTLYADDPATPEEVQAAVDKAGYRVFDTP